MLASSSQNEPSLNGYFTDVVLQMWSRARDDKQCLKPSDLHAKVQSALLEKSRGFMTCDLVFGAYIQSCFVELAGPSWMLLCEFSHYPKYPIQLYRNQESAENRLGVVVPPKDIPFVRHLPREPLTLIAKCEGKEIGRVVVDPATSSGDVLTIPITIPEEFRDEVLSAASAARQADEAGRLIEAFGGDPHSQYLKAAKLFTLAGADADNSALLRKVVRSAPKGSIAFKSASLALGYEKVSSVGIDLETATTLQQTGSFAPAAEAFLYLSKNTPDRATRQAFLNKSAVNLKASGRLEGDAFGPKAFLELIQDAEDQKYFQKTLDDMKHKTPGSVRTNLTKFERAIELPK
jgi:hypothetical protein